MKIAITIYNKNISNVFDFAHRLLLVDIDEGKEFSRCEVFFESQQVCRRLYQLKNLEVDVLICGAISRNAGNMIMESGIKILPYVTGNVDDILRAYLGGNLVNSEFSMPGYWQGARKGFGRGGGRGRQWRGGRC